MDTKCESPKLVNLATVTPRPVHWLWTGRIALGKLTLLAGEPGLGKSFLTMDLSARITTGSPWPDDPHGFNLAGSVVLMSAEDDVEDTISPRLHAAGADMQYVTALQGIETRLVVAGPAKQRSFNLEDDLPHLEQAILSTANCRLVIIDPVSAYLGGKDSHKNAEIRGLLAPLADLAAKHRVAVVAVTHLNKAAGGKAMHRVTGSLAFIAAARAGWLVAADKADPKRRLLLPIKNNLAEGVGGLAFSIIHGAVAWENGSVTMSADEALSDDRQSGGQQREDAAGWLQELLSDGAMCAGDVYAAAKDNGISKATLRRAGKSLGIVPCKVGYQKNAFWRWSLPRWKQSEAAEVDEVAQSADVSTFDIFDAEGPPVEAVAASLF